jgi:hypothetical protein
MVRGNVQAVCRECSSPVPVFGLRCTACCTHGLEMPYGEPATECSDCTEVCTCGGYASGDHGDDCPSTERPK